MTTTRFSLRPKVDPLLLQRRVRLITYVGLVALTSFAISDIVLAPDFVARLWLLKLPLYVAYGLILLASVRFHSIERTIGLGLIAVFFSATGTALSGFVTGDATSTQMLCMTGMLMTAIVVPWGGSAQAIACLIVIAAMGANAWVVGEAGYPFVAASAIILASVFVADRLRWSYESERELRREIEENARFLRNITDQLPALIAYVDTRETYQFVNRAQVEWARITRAEMTGKTVAQIAAPEVYAILEPHIRTALSGRRSTFELEVESPDHTLRSLAAVLEPDLDDERNVRGFFCLLNDITDRKQAEESARRQQAELAHVLRVSTMGEMTATLAHELNQPLTAIAAYAGTCAALAEAGPENAHEVQRSALLVADEALRAGKIIRRLEQLVRKSEPRYERANVLAIVTSATERVRGEAVAAGIQLRTEFASGVPDVYVDTIQIEQVLQNLLLNSIQAIERDRTERTEAGVIEVRVTTVAGSKVAIRIRDNGPGVAREIRKKIFEPYFTTREKGLGMGLAISRSILDFHRGTLRLEDEPGPGAVFTVELPAHTHSGSEASRN